jgi:NTP pyrophosphatase (non-canonical NTP hydrolase)
LGVLEEVISSEAENIAEGFGYRNKENAIAKLKEEFFELLAAIESESRHRQEEELGDLLYMIASIRRLYDLDEARAGKFVTTKLRARIDKMRSLSPLPIGELSDEQQTVLLKQVKEEENTASPEQSLEEFTSKDVEILVDALVRYDMLATSAEEHFRLCQLVAKVHKLRQNHEQEESEKL